MSDNVTPTAARERAWRTLLVSLLLAAACLVVVEVRATPPASGSNASYSPDAPRRWAGFTIPRTGRAAGGWIGGYQVDGVPLFVITPARKPNRRGYEPAQTVAALPGHGSPSRGETRRAAWVLSKYGGYRDAVQAAAVDAVVYHLLVGGAWRITREHGARRIRASGDPASVRRFARIMLRQSRSGAGAYHASLTASGADAGGVVSASVLVTDGDGRATAGLPVTFSSPGAQPVDAVTGDDGRAAARFPAPTGGWQDVAATVGQVPDHRLHVREPSRRGRAMAAEGGVRRTLGVTARAAVRGPQALSLKASPDSLTLGAAARIVATISGDGEARTASASLYGPFASAGVAGCSTTPVATVSTTVTANGDYTLPPVSPAAGGFYAWRVVVDGTATSLPVAVCGGTTKVRGQTTTVLASPASSAPGNVTVAVTVAGVPLPVKVDVTIKLFGPYGSLSELQSGACSSALAQSTVSRTGNGQVVSGPFYVSEPGLYAWQAETQPGDLWQGSQSTCAAPGTTLSVS